MRLKNFARAILFLLFASTFAFSQQNQVKGDVCHVYLVDVDKATKAIENNDEKLDTESQTIFPTFITEIGEETETTKTYPFPKTNLFIVAQVFYTDESLYSKYSNKDSKYVGTGESIIITIAISKKKNPKELTETINSSAEVTYDEQTNKVRTKQFIVINKKKYLVGLECDCSLKRQTEK